MLCIVGLVLWAVSQVPMDPTIARIIRVVVIVAVCLWLISLLFGYSGAGFGPRCRSCLELSTLDTKAETSQY